MRFDVITLFPEFVDVGIGVGVIGRAKDRGIIRSQSWNPRDFTTDPYRRVDERTFGGGPGMVMMVEPLARTLEAAKQADSAPGWVVHPSPRGRPLTQARIRELAELPRLILVASRYEGVDQRFIDHYVDEELSLGDFVLAGGELPALAIVEAVTRLLPGVLNDDSSAAQDSFSDPHLLDCPHYTRPELLDEGRVPAVLLSGNHGEIERWRRARQLQDTLQRRPDLLKPEQLSESDGKLLRWYEKLERQPKNDV
ncbi:MAG: tRNA (guanosine(37)-N1)-methyltransferase TrmD [Xanthomonadales bacterium]|nr:tRNA (guanosine(37)-N1)-methyltransferase TrmD [Xanthomonadales bacterium]